MNLAGMCREVKWLAGYSTSYKLLGKKGECNELVEDASPFTAAGLMHHHLAV